MVGVGTSLITEQRKRFMASHTFRLNARPVPPLSRKGHLNRVESIRVPVPFFLTHEIGHPGVLAGTATGRTPSQPLDSD